LSGTTAVPANSVALGYSPSPAWSDNFETADLSKWGTVGASGSDNITNFAASSPISGSRVMRWQHFAATGSTWPNVESNPFTEQVRGRIEWWMRSDVADQVAATTVERQYPTAGRYLGTLRVTDSAGLACSSTVVVRALGTTGPGHGEVAPYFLGTAAAQAQCGLPLVFPPSGIPAVEGTAAFQWGLLQSLAGLELGSQGELRWTPTSADVGVHRVVLTATNQAGQGRQEIDVEVVCPARRSLRVACGCGQGAEAPTAGMLLLALFALRRRRPATASWVTGYWRLICIHIVRGWMRFGR
jgi:hypothetical protein